MVLLYLLLFFVLPVSILMWILFTIKTLNNKTIGILAVAILGNALSFWMCGLLVNREIQTSTYESIYNIDNVHFINPGVVEYNDTCYAYEEGGKLYDLGCKETHDEEIG